MPSGDVTSMARPLALQASLFGALGLGAYVLRRLSTPALHPVLAEEHPEIAAHSPALAATASQLATLQNEAGLRDLVRKIAEVVRLDLAGGPTAQWRISRLNTDIVNDARSLCARAPRASSEDLFRAVLDCQNETIPQLQGHLDNLLHNHLLARSPLGS